jgi:hypothetical protein
MTRYPGYRPNHTDLRDSSAATPHQSEPLPKRPNDYHSHTPWAKRRRVDYNPTKDLKPHPGSTPTTTITTAAINAPSRLKFWKGRKPEVTELLIDLPPDCRKGAPGCNSLRKQWIKLEAQRIYRETGVMVEFLGVIGNTARFVCADDQTPPSIGDQEEGLNGNYHFPFTAAPLTQATV